METKVEEIYNDLLHWLSKIATMESKNNFYEEKSKVEIRKYNFMGELKGLKHDQQKFIMDIVLKSNLQQNRIQTLLDGGVLGIARIIDIYSEEYPVETLQAIRQFTSSTLAKAFNEILMDNQKELHSAFDKFMVEVLFSK